MILGLIPEKRLSNECNSPATQGRFSYTAAWEISSLRTRFSGKRLETDHPWKMYVKKLYY